MALFGRKNTEKAKATGVTQTAPAVISSAAGGLRDLSHVLQRPRITEKATMHQEMNIYTFDVNDAATKSDVAQAVRSLYGVKPRKVHVVRVPAKEKRSTRTGARSMTGGGRKAYVYLKKGETITIT